MQSAPVRVMAAIAAILFGVACGDSAPTEVVKTATLSDLVGTWTVEVWEYSRASDASQKADWVVTQGLTGSLTVATDGAFQVTPALDSGTGNDDGQLTVEGDSIYWNGQNDEEWVRFELATTLTVYWPETSFVDMDRDSQPEDAWLRVVFRRV